MSSIQFRDITGNPFGIGAPKTDNQNKYKILLVKNKFGEFYLTDEDNERINNLNLSPYLKENLKNSIAALSHTIGKGNENFFINDGAKIFLKKEGLDYSMSKMKEHINTIGREIQSVANLEGPKYFEKIREKWNSVNFSDKNKTDLLQILKARQQALKTDPTLAHDTQYEYKLTVRLNKDNNRCDKKQDLSVPDGEWDKFATNGIDESTKKQFSDLISAVYEERRCSATNQFMDNTKSTFSNTLSRFRSSSSSPAAGGRRTKKRSSRRARKTRAKKSSRRARARRTRK